MRLLRHFAVIGSIYSSGNEKNLVFAGDFGRALKSKQLYSNGIMR